MTTQAAIDFFEDTIKTYRDAGVPEQTIEPYKMAVEALKYQQNQPIRLMGNEERYSIY